MRKSHNLLSHTEISKICKSKGGVAQVRVRAPPSTHNLTCFGCCHKSSSWS